MKNEFPFIALGRLGKVNPYSIEDYLNTGGFNALNKALELEPTSILESIEKSGLRGRGGAGFPTGKKLRYTRASANENRQRFVVCNADEGEPGTFKDRAIMENDPFLLVEAVTISAFAIGASKGYVYLRAEYYLSVEIIGNAISECYKLGYLGQNILGSGFSFDLEIALGAGSYLCGEELTLLESLEGKRGNPRIKPPFPAEKGLWGLPTLVNNVETLAHIPFIINHGHDKYARIGTEGSKGTKLFCVSGRVCKPGVYELPMGITLRELLFEVAGGMKDPFQFKGALLGGAAGTFVDCSMLDVPLAYETLKEKGASLGSGAVIVIDDQTNLKELLISILNFFKHESCGKCVPCRIGTALLVSKLKTPDFSTSDFDWMTKQSTYMANNSLCPLGSSPDLPLKSFARYFINELDGK